MGKARDLQAGPQYFHPSRRMGWDLKFNALVDAIHDFDWHVVKNEPESLLLEGRLIKDFQPGSTSISRRQAVPPAQGQVNDPIPRFTLTRLRKDDGAFILVPLRIRRSDGPHVMRRKFHLRGCRR